MQRDSFRLFVAVFAIWATLGLPSIYALAPAALNSGSVEISHYCMTILGVALIPISSFGLWHEKLWGFIGLLIGLLLMLFSLPSASHIHLAYLIVTMVRYLFPKNDLSDQSDTSE